MHQNSINKRTQFCKSYFSMSENYKKNINTSVFIMKMSSLKIKIPLVFLSEEE